MSGRADVIVIGGGVIGLACANALLDAGRSVHIVEREALGSGASHGNCGLITPSHALPLTRPGMVRKVLRMMWRADSPILFRPRLDLELLAWGLRFARNCGREAMLTALRGRGPLLESSRELYVELIEKERLSCEWETLGLLDVFATVAAREEAEPWRRLLGEHGVRAQSFDRRALLELEPALRDDLHGALWYERDAQLRPEQLVAELARVVRAKGAKIDEGCSVHGFEHNGTAVHAVATDRGRLGAGDFVVATGAWSPELGRRLGVRVPVQPGKGYAVTTPRPEPCPRLPLLLHEANMGITPWPGALRLAGTMEFAGYDERLCRPRLDALRAGAERYIRQPPGDAHEEWCGWRPMTPDELPIIDRVPRRDNVLLATGHGMMGVSMAPATGRLVAEMITRQAPFLDVAPYSLARFR